MGEIWVAAKSLVVFNRRVLIIRRSNYVDIGQGEWDIPGGGIRFGESLLDCLHREIEEETGLIVCDDRLLYAITALVSPTRQIVGLTYQSHADSNTVTLSHEHSDFLWATKKQLQDLISKPYLKDFVVNSIFDILDID